MLVFHAGFRHSATSTAATNPVLHGHRSACMTTVVVPQDTGSSLSQPGHDTVPAWSRCCWVIMHICTRCGFSDVRPTCCFKLGVQNVPMRGCPGGCGMSLKLKLGDAAMCLTLIVVQAMCSPD